MPLLGAIAGDRRRGGCTRCRIGCGCTRWRIGCGDVTGCHCWAAIAARVGVYVGGLDVVPLLAAIAGRHCWAPLLGAIAGLPLLWIGVGWVHKLADWMW